jgi:DNA polymerase III epsilon subunit-like protein
MQTILTNIFFGGIRLVKTVFSIIYTKTEELNDPEDAVKDNDVKDNDVKDNDVKDNDVKDNDVKDNDVKDNDVKDNDVKDNEILLHEKLSVQIPEPKYYMFLDTETTGIPEQKSYNKYFEPHLINYYDSSRLVELGYMITDDVGNIIKKQSYIVKPNGFTIKNSQIHGITMEQAETTGLDIELVLEAFYIDLKKIDRIIGHNINFDKNILLSECYREYMCESSIVKKIKTINMQCTMEMGKRKLSLEKPPKLIYLHKLIFNRDIVQEHRALSDVYMCYECYFNIYKLR